MPKVIEKVREQLLEEVRREIKECGYEKMTVRSVAAACSLAVGTVYNYFPTKDMLIATVMSEDWNECRKVLESSYLLDKRDCLFLIYETLRNFTLEHEDLFKDREAKKKFLSIYSERHSMMRKEIAKYILPLLEGDKDPEFLSLFIAESLITAVMNSVEFERIYEILEKLL